MNKKLPVLFPTIFFCIGLSNANENIYLVQKGDTLSSVLFDQNISPIYGKRGALKQILKLNPQLKFHGNKIYPGTKINLGLLVPMKESPGTTAAANEVESTKEAAILSSTPLPEESVYAGKNFFMASPFLSWKSLTSKESNIYRSSSISALSGTNYGASLTFGRSISEHIDLYGAFSAEAVRFSQDEAFTLTQQKFTAMRGGAGVSFEKRWSLEAAVSDEFYLTSPSLNQVEIKKVSVPELRAAYKNEFYEYKTARFYYGLSARALAPGKKDDFKTNFGQGYGGAIEGKIDQHAFKLGYDLNLLRAAGNSTNYQNIYWQYIWETL